MNQVVILEASAGEIWRPRIEKDFEKIPGISTSYGFMAAGSEGAIAYRGFDCWCRECLAATGQASGSMDSNCRVTGCLKAQQNALFGQYHMCSVNRLDPRGVAGSRLIAQSNGHLIAGKLKVGMLLAAQTRVSEEDQYSIGVAVDAGGCLH